MSLSQKFYISSYRNFIGMSSVLRDDFKNGIKGMENYISLIVSSAMKYQNSTEEVLGILLKDKTPGIYVTLNKPYDVILRSVKKLSVDPRLVIFIDGITNTGGDKKVKVQNCLFIGSPVNVRGLFFFPYPVVWAIPG